MNRNIVSAYIAPVLKDQLRNMIVKQNVILKYVNILTRFFFHLIFFIVFLFCSKSHHQSHLSVERRGRIHSRTSEDQFSWTRFCCPRWRCRTHLSSTRTPGPPSASTARSSSRGSSGRACSAKVRITLLPNICHQPFLADEFLIFICFRFKSLWLDCRFNCHKRCAPKVPNNCLGEVIINGGA